MYRGQALAGLAASAVFSITDGSGEASASTASDTVSGAALHVQSAALERARRIRGRAGPHHPAPARDTHAACGGHEQAGNGREYGFVGLEDYLVTTAFLGYFPE